MRDILVDPVALWKHLTIGDESGLHMVIDGQGQRIYNGDRLVWP